MTKKSYYLDPRWQKFRLQILEIADWKCHVCGDSESTLNVHHRFYISGRKPWEYLPETMMVLCNECHDIAHEFYSNFDTLGADKWEKLLEDAFLHEKCTCGGFDDAREVVSKLGTPTWIK